MSTRPRYVPHTTGSGKWDNTDINAIVDHVLAGETVSGFLAYPYSYLVRALAGGIYDAIDATGTRVYGGPDDAGDPPVDGHDRDAVEQACIDALEAGSGGLIVLAEVQLGTVTYDSTVFIICNYQGTRTYYTNNKVLFACSELASLQRGDILTAQTATPLLKRLAKGSANQLLKSDGTDINWATLNSDIHGVLGIDRHTHFGKVITMGAGGDYECTGSNDHSVFNDAIDDCEDGDTILVKNPGITPYGIANKIFCDKSLSIIGEGWSAVGATVNPDSPPTSLKGTVLKVTADLGGWGALAFYGNPSNIRIKNLGIWMNGKIGNGLILQSSAYDWGTIYGQIENVGVLDNYAGSYAFLLQNFQHLTCRNLYSWGAEFLEIEGNDADIDYGNSCFDELYTYTNTAPSGENPVVNIHLTTGNKMNLFNIRRLQCNSKAAVSNAVVELDGCRYGSFENLNVETDHQYALIVKNSEEITFNNPYIWSTNTPPEGESNIHFENTASNIMVLGGALDVKVLDTGTGVGNLIISPKTNWLIDNSYLTHTEPVKCRGKNATGYVGGIYVGT